MNTNKKYSAIILSAGKSTRMGIPKFSLKFNDSITFLENIINEYSAFGCEEIIAVVNPDSAVFLKQLRLKLPLNTKLVINEHPEWERFYSLKLAAKELSKLNPVFVSNIDNPFVNHYLLHSLANSCSESDYIHPVYSGKGGHPFLLSEKVISDLISEPKNQIHLKEFLGRYSKTTVDTKDDKILININTEDDYRKYIT